MMSRAENLSVMIKNSKWLEREAYESLHLETCKFTYEIFERVLVNIAASSGYKWKELHNAKPYDKELFSELVVALMIIKRGLMKHFEMDERSVNVLLGDNYVEILENHSILF